MLRAAAPDLIDPSVIEPSVIEPVRNLSAIEPFFGKPGGSSHVDFEVVTRPASRTQPVSFSHTPEAFQIVAGGPQTTGSFVLLNPHAEGVPDVWHPSGVQTTIDLIRWSPLRSDHRLLSETPPA